MIVQSEENLRVPSEEVTLEEGEEIALLLRKELSKCHNGVGLSAPQIGINKRVIILHKDGGILDLINPKIIKLNNPFMNIREGCLSFPGVWLNTIRYRNVLVEDDLNGKIQFSHFASIIVQHEIDHLNGVLFMDRKAPGPYDNCFCGSGKKFKFCHQKKMI